MSEKRSELIEIVKDLTHGLLTSVTDFMLLSLHYNFTFENPSEQFQKIPLKTMKRSLIHLKSKGFIEKNASSPMGYLLTHEGKKHLSSLIPKYKDTRPWDASVYLVTYDLPTSENALRGRIRRRLLSLNAGTIADSVWITTSDPSSKLKKFPVTISSFQKPSENLIVKAFKLDELEYRYNQFITFSHEDAPREDLIIMYLSILKRDPQLPFGLLPVSLPTSNAQKIFQKLVSLQPPEDH